MSGKQFLWSVRFSDDGLFAEDRRVEAQSPIEAAKKISGCAVVRHRGRYGGDIIVRRCEYPYGSYLYDIIKLGKEIVDNETHGVY